MWNYRKILTEGLAALEYRGYDSAGIAYFKDTGKISIRKTVGKVKDLLAICDDDNNSTCGIGHTRWATHGGVSTTNSHPHTYGRVTLIHNGIIENYKKLEEEFRQKGQEPISQTDTEIAAMVINDCYDGNPVKAIKKAVARLEGAYAFCIMFEDYPGVIYAIRSGSPLVATSTQKGSMIASDMVALLKYSKDYFVLPEHHIARLTEDEIVVTNMDRMNISLQNVDKVSALLTVNIEKADYQEKVEKVLKTYRQKANIPGFRKGMVPMSLIKKQFGKAVLAEEVDKLMQEKVNEYIHENKVNMLGMPLPNAEKMQPVDFDTQENFEFVFDIALAPEFNAEITNQDTVDYYTIEVADELVEQQVKMYTQRAGKYDKVEAYEDKDMIKGLLAELDENGNTKEGGIQVEGAVMMPTYMKNDDQKAIFNGAKVNDVLVFNPATAFDNNEAELSSLLKIKKEEVADVKGNFSFQVEEITRMVPAELNQELFDQVFGKDTVKSEEEFRAKIKEGIAVQFEADSNYKFLMDVRDYLTKRVGKLEFPDALLKRIMLLNNEEKGEAFVAENYEKSIEELTWHLIKEQLIAANEIKVEQADVLNMAKEATRLQFAQYGMLNIPEEMLENYAKEMLKKKESVESLVNRAVESKLAAALKEKATLNHKSVTMEEFNKMFE